MTRAPSPGPSASPTPKPPGAGPLTRSPPPARAPRRPAPPGITLLGCFAASGAAPAERLRVAAAVARAVAELHGRGAVHGALHPGAVRAQGGAVALLPPAAGEGALARAGFDAPEVARGGRATRRSDAFSLGALAWLALAGRAPFEGEPLERVRKVLFVEAGPLRDAAPWVPEAVATAVAAALAKRPRRRTDARELARILEAAAIAAHDASSISPEDASLSPRQSRGEREDRLRGPPSTPPSTPTSTTTSTPTPTPTSTPTATPTATATSAPTPSAWRPRLPRRLRAPIPAAAVVALAVAALVVLLLPERERALARDVATLLEEGKLDETRRRLDVAAEERPGHPLVEKLRGDLACARGAAGECVRRYRVALAARPSLREDGALRANARRLLGSDQDCRTRRAAAHLLGELRDPAALPALEAARRSSGLLGFLCTGDSIDRAIAATRAAARR